MNNKLILGGLVLAFFVMNKEEPKSRKREINSKIIYVEVTPALGPPLTNINT